eukprot:TRINITY_DN8925_c0_g2_i1.p1 TRINITY_DN8925_c0_g2~~TRINITY_DN8925_c0_g2_i1.p1  ORF type:complete len:457 (-),score=63.18 TRINITY_DN8925_c0_g2_i1:447-1817(-)
MTGQTQFKYKTFDILGKRKRTEPKAQKTHRELEGDCFIVTQATQSTVQQELLQRRYDQAENEYDQQKQNRSLQEDQDQEQLVEDFIAMDEEKENKKSKRDSDYSDVNTESDQETGGPGSVPWIKYCRGFNSRMAALHNEIVQFCKCLEATAQERRSREEAVAQVTQVIKSIWKDSKVMVFGSFATGLYVPTSDIDLVVVDEVFDVDRIENLDNMRACANLLTRQGVAENAKVISKAKVPIIKFEHAASGVNIDVSFGKANGPQAAEYIKRMLEKWPMMRNLIMLLKVFLQQREMNEVFTGGIGSYALVTMVVAALQFHHSRRTSPKIMDTNLGILLVDFFRLYGRVLNFETVGVSANDGGHFYLKRSLGFMQNRPFIYSVQDPNDPTNDLTKGSWASAKVRNAFDHAYVMLSSSKFDQGESMLGKLLCLDSVLAGRGKSWKELMNRKMVQKRTSNS